MRKYVFGLLLLLLSWDIPRAVAEDEFFNSHVDMRLAMPINDPANFTKALEDNDFLFAMFTLPACPKCQTAYVELEILADDFEDENVQPGVKFCQVDGTTEGGISIGKRFLPKPRFPQFVLFRNGAENSMRYEGDRTASAMRAWIEKKTNHKLVDVETLADLNEMKKTASKYTLLAIFGNDDVTQRDALMKASVLIDEPCGVAGAALAEDFAVVPPALLIFTRYDGQEVYTANVAEWDSSHIAAWATAHHFPLLSIFDDEFAPKLFRSPLRVATLMFLPSFALDRQELLRQAFALNNANGERSSALQWANKVKEYERNELALQLRIRSSDSSKAEWPFAGEGCGAGWFGDDCDSFLGPALNAFAAAAMEHREAAHFVLVPDSHSAVCGFFEVDCDRVRTDGPRVVLADSRDQGGIVVRHHFEHDRPLAQLSDFIADFKRGRLSYVAKSEPAPDRMAGVGHVAKVVGSNFDEVVLGPAKAMAEAEAEADAGAEMPLRMDVLLYVYSEHCAPCRDIHQMWEKVARHFGAEAQVRVAKIDGDKNEHPLLADVKGFPTFRLYLSTGLMVNYNSKDRSVSAFHRWVEEYTTLGDFDLEWTSEDDEAELLIDLDVHDAGASLHDEL